MRIFCPLVLLATLALRIMELAVRINGVVWGFAVSEEERIAALLADLTELSRRHGMYIVGCGCCDSPFLFEFEEGDREGFYRMEPEGKEQIEFVLDRWMCKGCSRYIPGVVLQGGLCWSCRENAKRGAAS